MALLGNFDITDANSIHATYLWDAENRLVEVIPSAPGPSAKRVKFRYDYMSRRVEKLVFPRNAGNSAWLTVPSDHRRWVYFGWLPILELKVTHATSGEETGTVIARKYTWGLDLSQSVGGAGGIGGLLACVDCGENTTASDDRTFAYFYDGNGNVTQLIETTGGTTGSNFATLAARYEYDPYGRPLLDVADAGISGSYAATNTFRYSTKPVDAETSFSYFGHRYYSATMGRWISRDPLTQGVVESEPPAFGVPTPIRQIGPVGDEYRFSLNRPLDRIDPIGLCPLAQPGEVVWGSITMEPSSKYFNFVGAELAVEMIVQGRLAKRLVQDPCCPKVGIIQIVRETYDLGTPGQWVLDEGASNKPFYPKSNPLPPQSTQQIGFRDQPGWNPWGSYDDRAFLHEFETCAVCVDAKGKVGCVLGCLQWGYDYTPWAKFVNRPPSPLAHHRIALWATGAKSVSGDPISGGGGAPNSPALTALNVQAISPTATFYSVLTAASVFP